MALTPALRQAIRLLQLSNADLRNEIRDALESNFMLEVVDDGQIADEHEGAARNEQDPGILGIDGSHNASATPDSDNDESGPDEHFTPGEWPSTPSDGNGSTRDYLQANLHDDTSLHEHLAWQVRIAPLDELDSQIALALVDAINDDGYLEDWEALCRQLCDTFTITPGRVERILAVIHGFEPSGVGARDIRECLRLQLLQSRARAKVPALRLLELPIETVARRDLAELEEASGLTPHATEAGLSLITSLQPHPGRPWLSTRTDYVEPDVIASRINNRWEVALNPAHLPQLRINAYYRSLILRADHSSEQRSLKQHLHEARSLIHGLSARHDTLLRVAKRIVDEQTAFLDYGEEAMRPLVLRTIAEPLGLHESTVSRATANKYMLTPRGLFELKYFFPSHVNTTHGGTCSATAIQAMIRRLIAQERPRDPLSDAGLSERLHAEGIQIARRTVAKYRENLRIPPSHERRMMV